VRVIVIADTHLRDGVAGRLPPPLLRALEGADLALHAGDVVTATALEELRALAPTRAVLGNNDHELHGLVPERLQLELSGLPVAMIHDSGQRAGREARLHRLFPAAALVVFGHSHVPLDAAGLGGQRLFNPGSPTQRRSQPRCSYGWLEIADGALRAHGIVEV